VLGTGWIGVCARRTGGKTSVISRTVASYTPSPAFYHREHTKGACWTFAGRYGARLLAGSAFCAYGSQNALAQGTEDDTVQEEKQAEDVARPKQQQDVQELLEQAVKFLRQAMAYLRAEAERVWKHLERFAVRASNMFWQLQERAMSRVTAGMSERVVADETGSGTEELESVEQAMLKGKGRELQESELAPSIFAVPDSIEKYFPVFVFFTIVLGVLTFNLLLRSRDTAYAKLGANQANNVVRAVSSSSHPRRATAGGPLQENQVTAGLVREVLDIVANHPPVIEALGKDIKEGRMNMVRDKKGGVVGSMTLLGQKGEHATVECHAVKDAAEHTLCCTSISVRLPGAAEPLSIPLATPE